MKTVYGIINSDGSIAHGSGNFSVNKVTETHIHIVYAPGFFSRVPAVTMSPYSAYLTANVVTNGNETDHVSILHAFTDNTDTPCGFSFIAIGE